MHTILSVCQQLRVNSERDAENITRMQNEYDALLERIDGMAKSMQNDKEIIAEQREQIGEDCVRSPTIQARHFSPHTTYIINNI